MLMAEWHHFQQRNLNIGYRSMCHSAELWAKMSNNCRGFVCLMGIICNKDNLNNGSRNIQPKWATTVLEGVHMANGIICCKV